MSDVIVVDDSACDFPPARMMSVRDILRDRSVHLRAVRRMLEQERRKAAIAPGCKPADIRPSQVRVLPLPPEFCWRHRFTMDAWPEAQHRDGYQQGAGGRPGGTPPRPRLRPVRDRAVKYMRYALKSGDVFVGTLYQYVNGRWMWYFDQEIDLWPARQYESRAAAFRAAKRAWAFDRKGVTFRAHRILH